MISRKQKKNNKDFNNQKYKILLDIANKNDNPLSEIPLSLHEYKFLDKKFVLECFRSSNLEEEKIDWLLELTRENMKELYEKSEWGWDEFDKRKELTHKTSYIVFVKDEELNKNVAFMHFRFEYDYEKIKGVCYCYELQVKKDYQRKGIGLHLMNVLKAIGEKFKMNKVLLTCFEYNSNALSFYQKKLGYIIDKCSPSRCVEGKTFYEILSLKLS